MKFHRNLEFLWLEFNFVADCCQSSKASVVKKESCCISLSLSPSQLYLPLSFSWTDTTVPSLTRHRLLVKLSLCLSHTHTHAHSPTMCVWERVCACVPKTTIKGRDCNKSKSWTLHLWPTEKEKKSCFGFFFKGQKSLQLEILLAPNLRWKLMNAAKRKLGLENRKKSSSDHLKLKFKATKCPFSYYYVLE